MTRKELINCTAQAVGVSTIGITLVDIKEGWVNVYAYERYVGTRRVEENECRICGTSDYILQYGLCPMCSSPVIE